MHSTFFRLVFVGKKEKNMHRFAFTSNSTLLCLSVSHKITQNTLLLIDWICLFNFDKMWKSSKVWILHFFPMTRKPSENSEKSSLLNELDKKYYTKHRTNFSFKGRTKNGFFFSSLKKNNHVAWYAASLAWQSNHLDMNFNKPDDHSSETKAGFLDGFSNLEAELRSFAAKKEVCLFLQLTLENHWSAEFKQDL